MKFRWFQFHLSTTILLMFAAGGLIWANVQQRFVNVDRAGGSGDLRGNSCFGFPVEAWCENGILIELNGRITERDIGLDVAAYNKKNSQWGVQFIRGRGIFFRQTSGEYNLFGIVINTLFALTVLFLVAFISEHLIRRKKKPSTPR